MKRGSWPVRVNLKARQDIVGALRWSLQTFGTAQALAYKARLDQLVQALAEDPLRPAARLRPDLGDALRVLHMRSLGLKGRHFAVFRIEDGQVRLVRVLHDQMDIARHVPRDPEDAGSA